MTGQTGDYDILTEWNNHKIRTHIPAIVYVSVLMIFGSFGNILVCIYFGCKTKRSTKSFFIVALAVFDLFVCLVTMPLDIVDLRFFFVYSNVPGCKIPRFLNHIATLGSASTLIAIAVDRYKRICKPLTPQLEIRHARIAIVLAGAFSLLLSWPSILLFDSVKVNVTDNRNSSTPVLQAFVCTTSKAEGNTDYIWAYNSVLLFAFLSAAVVLCTLYSLIGRSIYRYKKRRRNYTSVRRTITRPRNTSVLSHSENGFLTEVASYGTVNGGLTKSGFDSNVDIVQNIIKLNGPHGSEIGTHTDTNMEQPLSDIDDIQAASLDENANKNESEINTVKFTVLMLIVTIMFIVSYLPYIAFVIWRTLHDDYEWNFLTDSELMGFQIGLRSYLLSSVINPFVYGFFNDDFRNFFYRTFFPCSVKTGVDAQKTINNHISR